MNRLFLVSGATGHLGAAVMKELSARREKARVFLLEGDPFACNLDEDVEKIYGDVTDIKSLEKLFCDIPEGTEVVVIHIAGIVTISSGHDSFVREVNVGGTKNIISLCEKYGYQSTLQVHGLNPSYNFYSLPRLEGANASCAGDLGKFLRDLYSGNLVSEKACEKMLSLLKNQFWTNKIPAGVPEGTTVANKTGETSEMVSDMAIVYSPATDYIIIVIADGISSASAAYENIINISSLTYNWFNCF